MAVYLGEDKVNMGGLTDLSGASIINNQNKTVTPTTSQQSVTYDSGYTGLGTVTVNRIPTNYIIPTGNKAITSNGTNIDVAAYATASVNVPTGSTINNQNKTVSPSTSQQSVTFDNGYTGLGTVTVNAMPSGTAGTPTATKGTVSNHSVSVTPSVTNTSGYITGSTKTGTAVTVTASELASGNKPITENGTNIDVVGYSTVSVNVSGATSSTIKTGVGTYVSGSSSRLEFNNILGEPTSFTLAFGTDISIIEAHPQVSVLTFDGTNYIGQAVTDTTNAATSYVSTGFSHQYNTNNNGTIIINSTNAIFDTYSAYTLIYTYDGSSNDIQTLDVQVGSGATSITFTGLEDEPIYWSCIFKSNFGTSSGYQRVMTVVNYNDIGGLSMDSAARFSSNWTASYNNGSLTITSQGTNAGGYFHQPGYYQLTYAYDSGGNYQSKTVTPTTSQQVITADTGYEALRRVTVNAMPTGTAGTPTATKGSRVGNSITVTPTVTNTAGYIAGGTLTGTGVSVSASEVTNGTYSITADGTYNITNYASVSVNVGGGGDIPEPSNINVGTATRTLTSAASSISFTGLSGEPTSFAVCTSAGLSTGASPWKTAMVVYDGSMVQGDFITNTNNQQLATSTSTTYSSITFGQSYSNGTLTITGSGSNFQANEYTLVYTYNGSTSDVQTKTQTVGSGATSITFSGLSGTPKYFACIFEGTAGYYSTSNGYQRVIGVVHNGTSTYGVSMGSGAVASTTAWTYTYNNGSLTITSAGTNNGGYFHQATNVNYKLIYVV